MTLEIAKDIIPAISAGPFTATPMGLIIDETQPIPYEVWEEYGRGLARVEGAVQWVIGDWLNAGERKYGEAYSQALNAWPEYEYQSLNAMRWVAGKVGFISREINLSWTHHRNVAALEPEEQEYWLEQAAENGWTREKLRQAIRDEKRINPPPLPPGQYRVIYADPPWQYSDKLIDGYGAAEHHYPAMTLEALCALPVADISGKDSVLFLWATSPMLPEALRVMDAWGFEYKASFVWDKVRHNYGHYNSVRHELLLLGTRGSCLPDSNELENSVVRIERSVRHSEKPAQFREIIEKMYGGPKIELFAREATNGWGVWGNEAVVPFQSSGMGRSDGR